MKSKLLLTILLLSTYGLNTYAQRQQTNHANTINNVKEVQKNNKTVSSQPLSKPIEVLSDSSKLAKEKPVQISEKDTSKIIERKREIVCDSLSDLLKITTHIRDRIKEDIEALYNKLIEIEGLLLELQYEKKNRRVDSDIDKLFQKLFDKPRDNGVSLDMEIGTVKAMINELKNETIPFKISNYLEFLKSMVELEKQKEDNCNPKSIMNSGANIKKIK